MKSEQWQQVERVYQAALECGAEGRVAFLAEACAGDDGLRREVESLLAYETQAEDFIESPALEVAVRMLAEAPRPTVVAGQTINQYRVTSPLGAGGMGEVYLAEDTRLQRKVALKFLPALFTRDEGHLRRFEQEARAVAALSHPNVCTIYEVVETGEGRHCIVMEYVEGVTLRTRMRGRGLSLANAVDIVLQITGALSAAHGTGIVHRDIKPENVMVRPDGLVKVLDFGIAKYAKPGRGRDAKESWVKTAQGVIVGTTAYMSPEQARSIPVDARTDVWSLGVILYEMVARRLPFSGKTRTDRVAAILEREPEALGNLRRVVPAELERIVSRALAKGRDERYASVADMAEDLRKLQSMLGAEPRFRFALPVPGRGLLFSRKRRPLRLTLFIAVPLLLAAAVYFVFLREKGAALQPAINSIAVLPLKPISTARRDELYEIGIADSLIHRLSSIKGFVVRPLSATRKYADLNQDPVAAGKEQRVDYILASNYQLADGRIRITSQLFNVASGQIEETYKGEKDAGNVFVMQDAIAGEVGNFLQTRFATTSSRKAAKRGTSNEEAYRLYLQGMYLIDKETAADSKRAIELLDAALSLDSNYAKAWAGKARAHCSYSHRGGSSPDAEFAKAKPALERAFDLDGNLAEAYGVLGIIRADYDWDFADSEKQFLRAIQIDPNSDNSHRWYANRLAGWGRAEEAIARIKTAVDLNPGSVFHQLMYGRTLYFARRYAQSITQMQRVIEMDSTHPTAHNIIWRSYHMKEDQPRAYESFMRFQQLIGTKSEVLRSYETSFSKGGLQSVLLKYLEVLKAEDAGVSEAYGMAVLSAMLNQPDQSFRYLNEAVKNRSFAIASINGDPGLDSLRDDPRFAELVRRVESK